MHVLIRQDGEDLIFEIKAQPGAKKTEIIGKWESALKMKIAAKPQAGAANQECVRFFSEKLGIPKRAVKILHGEFATKKLIRIRGVCRDVFMNTFSMIE